MTDAQSVQLPQVGMSNMAPAMTPSKMEMHHKTVLETVAYPIGDMREQASDKMMWGFIIIGILVLVVIYLIIRHSREWYCSQLHKPFDESGEVMFVLLCVVVILVCYAMYRAYHVTGRGGYWTNMCSSAFIITMLLLILWAYLLFRHHSLDKAFYCTIAILAGTIWLMWCFWKSNDRASFYLTIPLLLYAIVLCWQGWCIMKHAGNRIDDSSTSRSRSRSPSRERRSGVSGGSESEQASSSTS